MINNFSLICNKEIELENLEIAKAFILIKLCDNFEQKKTNKIWINIVSLICFNKNLFILIVALIN